MGDLTDDLNWWYQHCVKGDGECYGQSLPDLSDRPLWITETGCVKFNDGLHAYADDHGWTSAWKLCRDEVMESLQDWLDGQSRYSSLFWFITHIDDDDYWKPQFLVDGGLTPLGSSWEAW